MVFNLFSIFEPWFLLLSNFNINYLILLSFCFFSQSLFLINKQKYLIIFESHLSIKNFFLLLSIAALILYLNLAGLIPWVGCNTSHIIYNMPVAISFWLSIIFWQISKNVYRILINITPKGSPLLLRFFIVFIETIRKLIQPLTLSLRLRANMIAGHMIVRLLRSFISIQDPFILLYNLILILIILLELGVSVIQSYIFVFLLYLYIKS